MIRMPINQSYRRQNRQSALERRLARLVTARLSSSAPAPLDIVQARFELEGEQEE